MGDGTQSVLKHVTTVQNRRVVADEINCGYLE
jgi:hypothetical protein